MRSFNQYFLVFKNLYTKYLSMSNKHLRNLKCGTAELKSSNYVFYLKVHINYLYCICSQYPFIRNNNYIIKSNYFIPEISNYILPILSMSFVVNTNLTCTKWLRLEFDVSGINVTFMILRCFVWRFTETWVYCWCEGSFEIVLTWLSNKYFMRYLFDVLCCRKLVKVR